MLVPRPGVALAASFGMPTPSSATDKVQLGPWAL